MNSERTISSADLYVSPSMAGQFTAVMFFRFLLLFFQHLKNQSLTIWILERQEHSTFYRSNSEKSCSSTHHKQKPVVCSMTYAKISMEIKDLHVPTSSSIDSDHDLSDNELKEKFLLFHAELPMCTFVSRPQGRKEKQTNDHGT